MNISNNKYMRCANFSAGPSKLPDQVFNQIKEEAFDYNGKGFAVFEISHRSKYFENILNDVKDNFKKIYNISDSFEILFIHGGASFQFAMIPLNFMQNNKAAYINSGLWSTKAINTAKEFGEIDVIASSENENYSYIPDFNSDNLSHSYLHITSNNSIYGTQFHQIPTSNIPLIVDCSSDILSKNFEFNKISLAYGSNQKNFGVSGVGFAVIKKSFLHSKPRIKHPLFSYIEYKNNNSLFNTPNTFGIFVSGLICKWIIDMGGIDKIYQLNKKKAQLLYDEIDNSNKFYIGHSQKKYRSIMNISFKTPNHQTDDMFINDAEKNGLFFLKGHNHLKGIRASIYNSASLKDVKQLAEFMNIFKNRYG